MKVNKELLPIALIVGMFIFSTIAITTSAGTAKIVTCFIISTASTALYFLFSYFQRHPSLANGYNRIKQENRPKADRVIAHNIFILKAVFLAFFVEPVAMTALAKETNPWGMAILAGVILVCSIRFGIRMNRL